MDIRPDTMVSYQLLSLPMKIAQMQQTHSQRMLDMAITNKVEAILQANRANAVNLLA